MQIFSICCLSATLVPKLHGKGPPPSRPSICASLLCANTLLSDLSRREVLVHFVLFLHMRHAWVGVTGRLIAANLYDSAHKGDFWGAGGREGGDKKAENKNKVGVRGRTGTALTDIDVGVFISARRVKRETVPRCVPVCIRYPLMQVREEVMWDSASLRPHRQKHRCRSSPGLGGRVNNLHGGKIRCEDKKGASGGQGVCFDRRWTHDKDRRGLWKRKLRSAIVARYRKLFLAAQP